MSIYIPDRYKDKKYLINFYVLKYLENNSKINIDTLYDEPFKSINIFKFLNILEKEKIISETNSYKLIRYINDEKITLKEFLKIINIEKDNLIKLLNFYYSSISKEDIEDDYLKELYKSLSKYFEILPKEFSSKFQKIYESTLISGGRTTSVSLELNLEELEYDLIDSIFIKELKIKEEEYIKEIFEALEELETDDINLKLIKDLKNIIYEKFI